MRDLQLHSARMTGATRVFCEDYRRRQVDECADTWYKRVQPAETVELTVAVRQPANAPV